jgi:hypothetical protein
MLPLIYNSGIFNANNGTIEFNSPYIEGITIAPQLPLELNNVTLNMYDRRIGIIFDNTNAPININGNLTLQQGHLGGRSSSPTDVVNVKGDVLVQSAVRNGGKGTINIDSDTSTITAEAGAGTPILYAAPGVTVHNITANEGSNTYFGDDMNIDTLDLIGATTLHSDAVPTIRTLLVVNYNPATAPTLDYVVINPTPVGSVCGN